MHIQSHPGVEGCQVNEDSHVKLVAPRIGDMDHHMSQTLLSQPPGSVLSPCDGSNGRND